jgi:hypothetical protein
VIKNIEKPTKERHWGQSVLASGGEEAQSIEIVKGSKDK